MHPSIIRKVQSLGFQVWMRNEMDNWMLFVEGTSIGYLQSTGLDGFSVATVHKPNIVTGNGFNIVDRHAAITRETLEGCFITAPHWASRYEHESVVKYRNIEEYIRANSWNSEYRLVPCVQQVAN